MERLKAECDQYTVVSQDEVFDNLSHRALVHAFRKACLLYAANGMKWKKPSKGSAGGVCTMTFGSNCTSSATRFVKPRA